MDRRQIFDTSLYSEPNDLGLGVMSVPALARDLPVPSELLTALRLHAVAEVPQDGLDDAIVAMLATTEAAETASWLLDPPDPTRLLDPDDVSVMVTRRQDIAELRAKMVRAPGAAARAIGYSPRAIAKPRKLEKQEGRGLGINEFADAALADALVPLRRSPIDLYPLTELMDEHFRAFVVTLRKSPLVLVYGVGGFAIVYPIVSAVRGISLGIATGLRYRTLKLFGVPDDVIRAQMGHRDLRD